MELELKLAQTGHSEIIRLETPVRGDALMNEISKAYKINLKDQFLLTKTGHAIGPHDNLQKVILDDKRNETLSRDFQ